MIIKKNSWHFALLKTINQRVATSIEHRGTTLCDYVRAITACILLVAVTVSLALFALYLLVVAPVYTLAVGTPAVGFGLSLVLWFILAILGAVKLLFIVLDRLIEWLLEKSDNASKKPKKPNILVEYLKARKEKYCPIVKVE